MKENIQICENYDLVHQTVSANRSGGTMFEECIRLAPVVDCCRSYSTEQLSMSPKNVFRYGANMA